MDSVKVTNTEYVRDIKTMALIKTNRRALAPHKRYTEKKMQEKAIQEEINSLKSKIEEQSSMAEELKEIKSLLRQLGITNNG